MLDARTEGVVDQIVGLDVVCMNDAVKNDQRDLQETDLQRVRRPNLHRQRDVPVHRERYRVLHSSAPT